jgi:hypothetical protein
VFGLRLLNAELYDMSDRYRQKPSKYNINIDKSKGATLVVRTTAVKVLINLRFSARQKGYVGTGSKKQRQRAGSR